MMDILKHDKQFLDYVHKMKVEGLKDSEIAKSLALTPSRFRAIRSACYQRERARKEVSA